MFPALLAILLHVDKAFFHHVPESTIFLAFEPTICKYVVCTVIIVNLTVLDFKMFFKSTWWGAECWVKYGLKINKLSIH